eukprot:10430381-Prorocentrum_lima.AAC.1
MELRLKHGVQGNPVPLAELQKRVLLQVKRKFRSSDLLWYSRAKLWCIADALGLDAVANMSDEQYEDALLQIHDYYGKNHLRDSRCSWKRREGRR